MSEVLAGVDWELVTPPSFFFFSLKASECGQQLSSPFARPDFPLDNTYTFVGGASLAAKKGGKNLTAQKSCVVTDVQSSEVFQCAFVGTQGWGQLKHNKLHCG